MATIASRRNVLDDPDTADLALTIASVPAGHPYVAKVTESPGITLLPDQPVPGAPREVWWPPVILDPDWIERNRRAAQILHIHFGTESFPPGHLTAVIDAAHRARWPVVYTAHDLEHPQLGSQTAYVAQLDELLRGADAVVTLTEGAASVIRERWSREAVVIAHPSVLDPDAVVPRVHESEEARIGVHLKDLRPNVDGPGTVAILLAATGRLRAEGVSAVAEIRLHHRVRDDVAREEIRRLCAANEHARLIEHERLSDAELAIALSRLDACVLPYRHGTHSGWLELCWDLGVPTIAPTVGFYAEQHTDGSATTFRPRDVASLGVAISRVLTHAGSTRPGTQARAELVDVRRAQRRAGDSVAAAMHAALYRRLASGYAS